MGTCTLMKKESPNLLAGAKVLVYVTWDLPNKRKRQCCHQFLLVFYNKGYFVQPDIVKYDGNKITKPGFDLIFGTNTLKELGILLNF